MGFCRLALKVDGQLLVSPHYPPFLPFPLHQLITQHTRTILQKWPKLAQKCHLLARSNAPATSQIWLYLRLRGSKSHYRNLPLFVASILHNGQNRCLNPHTSARSTIPVVLPKPTRRAHHDYVWLVLTKTGPTLSQETIIPMPYRMKMDHMVYQPLHGLPCD